MSRDTFMRVMRSAWWLGLVSFALSAGLAWSLGNPQTIKRAIDSSRVYEAVAGMVTTASNSQLGPAIQPTIESAANRAFDPEQLKTESEATVDSIYTWLEGDVERPDIRIDLTPLRNTFVDAISQAADEHLANLPVCSPAQAADIDIKTADPLSLSCLPPGVSRESASQLVAANLQAANPLIQNPVLTTQNFTDRQGRNVFDTASTVPVMFQLSQFLPWIIAVGSALVLGCIFWLAGNGLRALYLAAQTMFWAGVILLVTVGLGHLLATILTQPEGSVMQAVKDTPQEYAVGFVRSIEQMVSKYILLIAVIYTVLGRLTASIIQVAIRRHTATVPVTTAVQPANSTDTGQTSQNTQV